MCSEEEPPSNTTNIMYRYLRNIEIENSPLSGEQFSTCADMCCYNKYLYSGCLVCALYYIMSLACIPIHSRNNF